jgi:hypothetical protein
MKDTRKQMVKEKIVHKRVGKGKRQSLKFADLPSEERGNTASCKF